MGSKRQFYLTAITWLQFHLTDTRLGATAGGLNTGYFQHLTTHVSTYKRIGSWRIILGHRTGIDELLVKLEFLCPSLTHAHQAESDEDHRESLSHLSNYLLDYIQQLLLAFLRTMIFTVCCLPPTDTVRVVLPTASPFTVREVPAIVAEATLPSPTVQLYPLSTPSK